MARTSAEITEFVRRSGNPQETLQKIWETTRYLVATKQANPHNSETSDGYFKGHVVVPGPKADPALQPPLRIQDYHILANQFGIDIIDTETTDGADRTIGAALYRPMDNDEANAYEQALRARNGKSKTVSGQAAQ